MMIEKTKREEWLCLVLEVPEAAEAPEDAAGLAVIAVPAVLWAEARCMEAPAGVIPDTWEAAFTVTDPLRPLHPQWETGIGVPTVAAAVAAVL